MFLIMSQFLLDDLSCTTSPFAATNCRFALFSAPSSIQPATLHEVVFLRHSHGLVGVAVASLTLSFASEAFFQSLLESPMGFMPT